MSRLRLFKVIGCFLLTFALGTWAGWMLKPGPGAGAPRAAGMPPGQRVMENLDSHLKLTAEQKAALRPLLEEWGRQVERIGRQPRRRHELFERYAPRIREHLTVQQQAEYDRMVADTRQRFERRLR